MEVRFSIPGAPKGKGRPRFTGYTTYTPKTTVEYEETVRWEYKRMCGNYSFGVKPLRVVIWAFFGIPKSATKKKRSEMISGEMMPTKVPDCDNIAKIVLDALNGIAYHDDSAVVVLRVEKFYADEPRVEVKISDDVYLPFTED